MLHTKKITNTLHISRPERELNENSRRVKCVGVCGGSEKIFWIFK